jgi:hypothetical protein
MISDRPAEDADHFDDDYLLSSYLGGQSPKAEAITALAASDWPLTPTQDLGLTVDAETLRWFETNHGDWRQAMCSVLRAWVEMRTRDLIGITARFEPLPC